MVTAAQLPPDDRSPQAADRLRVTALSVSGQLGGTERVLLDLARFAGAHGIDLRVISAADGPLLECLAGLEIPARVLAAPRELLRGSQRPGRLGTLPRAGMGLIRWARDLRHVAWMRDPDLLYSVGFKAHVAVALLRGRPALWHLHEFPPRVTGRLWRLLLRRGPQAAIANSNAVARAWQPGGPGRGPTVTVVPNGVDTERFAPRAPTGWVHTALGIEAGARLVGMPAVFARWKGQPEVITAFTTVMDAVPDAHLVLVGGSIYDTVAEREYERMLRQVVAAANRSAPRVHILPFQREIERVYPEFEVTVHYSLRPEPFGRVLIESMACGVPVVAAAEGGPTDIVTPVEGDGSPGWLARPREPAVLAQVLRAALTEDPTRRRQRGADARRLAERAYTASAFAREVCQVMRESSRRSRP